MNNTPIYYWNKLDGVNDRQIRGYGDRILQEVEWVQRDRTPRREAFYCTHDVDYTYGSGAGIRTYSPNLNIPNSLNEVWTITEKMCGVEFEACFLNRYDSQHDHLGWHADDSDVIDDARPIAVVSFGAERQLWFRANGTSGVDAIDKVLLEDGSVLMMKPGMQDTHQHRIPKHDRECGTRISLTFRGLVL